MGKGNMDIAIGIAGLAAMIILAKPNEKKEAGTGGSLDIPFMGGTTSPQTVSSPTPPDQGGLTGTWWDSFQAKTANLAPNPVFLGSSGTTTKKATSASTISSSPIKRVYGGSSSGSRGGYSWGGGNSSWGSPSRRSK